MVEATNTDYSLEQIAGTVTDPIELGVQLLAHLEHDELSLAETVDRIETVTSDPTATREILEEAQARDIIERDGSTVTIKSGQGLRFEREIITKEGEFDCRRCGAEISTGYFMNLEAGEHGPFGSTCIQKVTSPQT